MRSKYKDLVLEGRWKYKCCVKGYTFINIYNGKEIELHPTQLKRIIEGKDTISHIMCRRINGSTFPFENGIVKNWKKCKRKVIKGGK